MPAPMFLMDQALLLALADSRNKVIASSLESVDAVTAVLFHESCDLGDLSFVSQRGAEALHNLPKRFELCCVLLGGCVEAVGQAVMQGLQFPEILHLLLQHIPQHGHHALHRRQFQRHARIHAVLRRAGLDEACHAPRGAAGRVEPSAAFSLSAP